jgi:hypothetical protein
MARLILSAGSLLARRSGPAARSSPQRGLWRRPQGSSEPQPGSRDPHRQARRSTLPTPCGGAHRSALGSSAAADRGRLVVGVTCRRTRGQELVEV